MANDGEYDKMKISFIDAVKWVALGIFISIKPHFNGAFFLLQAENGNEKK